MPRKKMKFNNDLPNRDIRDRKLSIILHLLKFFIYCKLKYFFFFKFVGY
jgi:hypothetical protein